MEINKIIIGNRIKSLRLELNLTQEELAIKLGLKGKSSIANYEKGNISPSDDVKIQMCEVFDCSLDYLMCKTNIRNQKQENNMNEELLKVDFDMKNYNPPSDKQKEQIKALLEVILKDNKKDNNKRSNI